MRLLGLKVAARRFGRARAKLTLSRQYCRNFIFDAPSERIGFESKCEKLIAQGRFRARRKGPPTAPPSGSISIASMPITLACATRLVIGNTESRNLVKPRRTRQTERKDARVVSGAL
jgi:hypothetical protein